MSSNVINVSFQKTHNVKERYHKLGEELIDTITQRMIEEGMVDPNLTADEIEKEDFTTLLLIIGRLIVGYSEHYNLDPDVVPDKEVGFFKGLLAIYNMGAIDYAEQHETEEEETCC